MKIVRFTNIINTSKKFGSEIARLEQEKEQLIKEKSVLLKKIGGKKRKISALRKQLKKAEKTDQKVLSKKKDKKKKSFVSLKVLLFLPVLTITIVLSLLYMNTIFPFIDLDFISTHYPLIMPFIIFAISFVCLIVSIFYFALYQVIKNCGKAKRDASVKERKPLEWSQIIKFVAFLCVIFVLFSCFTIIITIEVFNRLFYWYSHELRYQFYPLIIGFWRFLWGVFCIKSYFMVIK